MIKYGYLQGTFGLPYGGYCVQPRTLKDVILDGTSRQTSMFCVIGKQDQVVSWLKTQKGMVGNRCTEQDTFTHDLAVEMYNIERESRLVRLLKLARNKKSSNTVQLVIRIARTWDQTISGDFLPTCRAIVPSGIALDEIAQVLERTAPGTVVDATSDKSLLGLVLSRTISLSSYCEPAEEELPTSSRASRQGAYCCISGRRENEFSELPPYACGSLEPPAYSV